MLPKLVVLFSNGMLTWIMEEITVYFEKVFPTVAINYVINETTGKLFVQRRFLVYKLSIDLNGEDSRRIYNRGYFNGTSLEGTFSL